MTREKLTARRRSKTIFVAALLLLTFSSWIWLDASVSYPRWALAGAAVGLQGGGIPRLIQTRFPGQLASRG